MKKFLLAMVLSSVPQIFLMASSAFAIEAANAPEVSLDEFKKIVETKGATIIDVNSVDTYKSGHVPGAINFAQNEKNFAQVLPKDKKALIVAYCGGPMCLAWKDAAAAAAALGYTNIKHFKGGIKGWKESGQKVAKGA